MNATDIHVNGTQHLFSILQVFQITKAVIFTLSFITYGFFLYFIFTILGFYFTTHHVRENPRYILFAHMLMNDTMYLSLGLFLGILYQFSYIPVYICYFLLTVTTATFRITPYNLAAMAFERYLAISFPLHYITLFTVQRSYLVIAVMWVLGLIPNIADFVVLNLAARKGFFLQSVGCKQEQLLLLPVQDKIRSFYFIISLVLVALIIIFTYVKVSLIAKKTRSSSSSASKAGRTVMLHAFQLLLSMVSLMSTITEVYGGDFLVMANFLLFMCVPRLLSPLIYGIRDEVFRKCIQTMYCKRYTKKQEPIKK